MRELAARAVGASRVNAIGRKAIAQRGRVWEKRALPTALSAIFSCSKTELSCDVIFVLPILLVGFLLVNGEFAGIARAAGKVEQVVYA